MEVIDTVIVGAGVGGLCAAIRLQQAKAGSVCILERGAEVGGTWRDNVYPGCACDVPSHLYSFSFEPNREWTRPYPQQPEIQAYIQRVTEKFQLRRLIRFGANVQAIRWQANASMWQIELQCGPPLQARFVILATGPLNKPLIPDLPGSQSFKGPAFHSSHWRHDVDLRGKRVAVVGTGASAVQFVPEIAPQAAHVDVFQRTAAWVLPRWDTPFGAVRRWLYRDVPGVQRLSRWRIYWFNELVGMGFMGSRLVQGLLRGLAKVHLYRLVKDPAMRLALTPDFAPGCKRLLISNTWFETLQKPHVALVTHAVAEIRPEGVVDARGRLHPCDVIIWGTGFKASQFVAPMRIVGEPDGKGNPSELSALWTSGAAATRRGITVAGFPNLFMLVGPSTGLGHNSIIFMIEAQMNYIAGAMAYARNAGRTVLRLRPEVQAYDYAAVQKNMQRTVWASGCKSWYQNANGQIDTLWPGYTWQYWLKTRRFQVADYL